MLTEIAVDDYAIIGHVSVRFARGLNVLPGETGAGKSILVGALSLVLGERVSDDIIRKGEDTCRVEAIFDLGGRDQDGFLRQYGLKGPDRCFVLSREVRRGGRSKCAVNGRALTLTGLREIGNYLVDLHGQHEHQLLLDARRHIDFLDGFGRLVGLRDEFDTRRKEFVELGRKIEEIEQEIADIESKGDFIRYEIAEIEGANLKQDEDAEIEREISLLEHAEKIIEAGSEAMDAIYDSDEAAMRMMSKARSLLERIGRYSEDLASLGRELEQAEVVVKEVAENLRGHLSAIDLDPARLEALRERHMVIGRMKHKYGQTVGDILSHLKRLKQGIENTAELEVEVSDIKSRRDALESELAGLAHGLSTRRRRAARRFEKLIEAEMASLGIDGAAFRVVFEDYDEGEEIHGEDGKPVMIGETGAEFAEFFVRTNPGEDLMHLRRIASGGEISRVMLALKKILADTDRVGTLIFDEIDSGIGGSMAEVVASKLHEVSRSRQVMCITHLPQIAALADLHLAVGKTTSGGRTTTDVAEVTGERRVTEVARMIGGRKPTKSARVHAEEILKRSVAK
jgi:DNA repair protein RecN (Recombination protein N)